jgi:hypothetical protein
MAAHPVGVPMARFAFPFAVALICLHAPAAFAGPYTEPGHAISEMAAWATEVDETVRGPQNIANPSGPDASFGVPENALGPVGGVDTLDVVSLGDGGFATLFFQGGISDGAGDDFAVFENGFFTVDGLFTELAFVEVSSNGADFARFDSVSLTPSAPGSFGTIDPTDISNLAGKQPIELGTGFDLAQLASHPLVTAQILDLDEVRYVRVVDVIGNGSTFDAQDPEHAVFDPYPTAFSSGGFDLQGIGVLNVPEPGAAASLASGVALLLQLGRRRSRRVRA